MRNEIKERMKNGIVGIGMPRSDGHTVRCKTVRTKKH